MLYLQIFASALLLLPVTFSNFSFSSNDTFLNLKFRDRIIFDGYPRSIDQAKNLDLILSEFDQKIDLIISLVVSREIIEKRIIGRVTCDKCNLTLNEFFNNEEIDLHPCGKEQDVMQEQEKEKQSLLLEKN